MMPVEGESRAASQFSAGSSARAASPERVCRSATPLASACALIDCSFAVSLRRGRDDQLAAIAMRDAVIAAILIERRLAADAHPRHQAAGLVIDAGVDHLAVARRGHGADTLGRLQHDHLAAGLRQPPRDRKTDHPRTDNDALDLVHSPLQIRIAGYRINARLVQWLPRPGSIGPQVIASVCGCPFAATHSGFISGRFARLRSR